jgi:hypothetical protein
MGLLHCCCSTASCELGWCSLQSDHIQAQAHQLLSQLVRTLLRPSEHQRATPVTACMHTLSFWMCIAI